MDARPDDDADADDITGAQHPTGPPARPDDASAVPSREPQPSTPEDDEVWASIVARLSDVDGGTDPALRRLLSDPEDGTPPPDDGAPAPGLPASAGGRDWDGTTQYDLAEDEVDDLEHFVPEDPGPVTSTDPLLTLAWGAAAGVPLFLLVVVTVWRDAPTLLVRAAAVVFVVAVAVLVWRMPQHREPTDGDGAVV
ncbi:hypothetical protein [Cellulomonas dongxiuzhuiae]|uniref:DUF3040 domain-containing protein n=1 Tax=Cellulomonas dongxiuzhuiae TaxID=2819979 RepID=A0ABX8GF86_9CELL|nr:hypothetical protein [Cellulomonas dongxiuzhuiae]MBO3093678.1 hypothetical protein [Cellulomonas dongxiuzhuiae]QWC14789.1 hypothetical protein KKR89_10475 [Cellulomonas dongxiuzhuiae]